MMKILILLCAIFYMPPVLADEGGEGLLRQDATKHDFSEYQLQGKMKAPSGFFLQGKKGQSLSQMVRLRPNFKRELKNSKSAIKHSVR